MLLCLDEQIDYTHGQLCIKTAFFSPRKRQLFPKPRKHNNARSKTLVARVIPERQWACAILMFIGIDCQAAIGQVAS